MSPVSTMCFNKFENISDESAPHFVDSIKMSRISNDQRRNQGPIIPNCEFEFMGVPINLLRGRYKITEFQSYLSHKSSFN